jgi:diguanylate cyclase (GGDEF)-like protein
MPDHITRDPQSVRLLLVEDDSFQRLVLGRWLSRAGYAVETAKDGDEAFAKLLDAPIHILITDWDMPGMDGATLCQRVRQADLGGYVYILMLTGHESATDVVAGLEAGADEYIRKPANEAELLARLKTARRILELERSLREANARVQRLSITDPVVGTYNRRYLNEQLPRDVERARRYGRPLALVMADLDAFKQINDVHGHPTGDQVLRCFAEHVQTRIRRSSDWVARYGGEEFVIVLPGIELIEAAAVAEKIRADCASIAMVSPVGPVQVTASFGVSFLDSQPDITAAVAELLRRADASLYKSKHDGRNRVTVAVD